MAKGMKCPSCKTPMFAQVEDNQPQGRYVTYVCRSELCRNKVKVFEKYADRR